MSVDVLHTDPAGQAQGRVRPHPVHHGPQLRQKRDKAEPGRNHVLLQGQLWGGPPSPGQPRGLMEVLIVSALTT